MDTGSQSPEAGYKAAMFSPDRVKGLGDKTVTKIKAAMGKDTQGGSQLSVLNRAIDTTMRPDVATLGSVTKGIVGTEKNPATGKDLQSELDAEATILTEIGGDADPGTFSAATITRVDGILSLVPAVKKILEDAGAERNTVIREMLADPVVRALIKDNCVQLLSESSIPTDEVRPATQEAARLKAKEDELRARRTTKYKQLYDKTNGALARYDSFQTGDLATTLSGLDGRIDEIVSTIGSSTRAMTRWGGEVSKTEKTVFDLEASVNYLNALPTRTQQEQQALNTKQLQLEAVRVSLEAAQQQFDAAQQANKTATQERAQHAALTAEKAALPQTTATLEEELAGLETRLVDATTERLLAAATRDQAIVERQRARLEFARKVKNILPEVLKNQLKNGDAARILVLQEETAQTTELVDKLMQREARVRYRKERNEYGRYDRKRSPLDSDMAALTVVDLRKPNIGRDAVLKSMLITTLQQEVDTHRMTQDEAEKMIEDKMSDKEWVQRNGAIAVEALIAARVNTGGLSENEANIVRNSSWRPDLITRALTVNPGSADAIKALRDQGIVRGELSQALSNADAKMLVKIFLTLFSGGAVMAGTLVGAVPAVGAGVLVGGATLAGERVLEEIKRRSQRAPINP